MDKRQSRVRALGRALPGHASPGSIILAFLMAFLGSGSTGYGLQGSGKTPPLQNAEPIHLGQTVEGEISPGDPALAGIGPSRRYEYLSRSSGSVTLLLDSFDFDAFLEVRTGEGDKVASDDDGGVETNARIGWEAEEDMRYVITACAKEGQRGGYSLALMEGRAPLPSGPALLEAALAYRAEGAERAEALGNLKTATVHRYTLGWLLFNASKLAEAQGAFQEALRLARTTGERRFEAGSLHLLGRIGIMRQDFNEAKDFFSKAIPLFRELHLREDEGWALHCLAWACIESKDYPEALESIEAALAIFGEIGQRRGEAWGTYNLGCIHQETGDYPKALALLNRSLALFEKLGDEGGEAWAKERLAMVFADQGDLPKAKALHEKALQRFRAQGDSKGELIAVGNLGNVFWFFGDYGKARECYEQKLQLATKLDLPEDRAGALENIGLACFTTGDLLSAKKYYLQALETGRRSANLVGSMGCLYFSFFDYPKARECFEEQLALAREQGEQDQEATALENLGLLYLRYQDHQRALEHYEQALAISQKIGARVKETSQRVFIGVIYMDMNDPARARAFLDSGLRMAEQLEVRRLQALAHHALGVLLANQKRYKESIDHLEKSLSIYRSIGEQVGEALALTALARRWLSTGDYPKARALAQEAIRLNENLGTECYLPNPMETLARIALMEGDAATTGALLEKAVQILDRPTLRSLEIEEAAGLRSYDYLLGKLAQDLTALRVSQSEPGIGPRLRAMAEGFNHAGLWKGRALLEGIVEHFQGGRNAEAIRLRREQRETRAHRQEILKRISTAIREAKPPEAVEAMREEARSLLEKADGLARSLKEASPRDAALTDPRSVDPDAVRRAVLDEGAMLIDYAEGRDRLYAYLLTKEDLRFLDLGPLERIEEAVSGFLSGITDPNRLGTVRSVAESGRALFDRLLAPALDCKASSIERLVVLPSPAIARVPLEALVMETRNEGGETQDFSDFRFVIDRYEVSYGPSAPVLAELASVGPRNREGRVLALADPWYPSEGMDAPEVALSSQGALLGTSRAVPDPDLFLRLEDTRKEALVLGRLLLRRDEDDLEGSAALMRIMDERSGSLSTKWLDLHLGKEAVPARLFGDLKQYSVLHLAAHGYVDQEFPQRTGLALAFSDEGDGFFTIADALELDLDAVLVVLSACDTAKGPIQDGEGVQSLARAFLYAGARAVVASLWRVADWAAADTFEVFYREALEQGRPPVEALRNAKLALRRSGTLRGITKESDGKRSSPVVTAGHPFFWAPFIHVGLPRR